MPDLSKTLSKEDFPYQPYYCEENVWWVCRQHPAAVADKAVLWMSNQQRRCPIWEQLASPSAEDSVVWDYHVVALVRHLGIWQVYDLDSRLAFPTSLAHYLTASFPFNAVILPEWRPVFKWVSADFFLKDFSSDRSHMRQKGKWLAEPPEWSPINQQIAPNMPDYLKIDQAVKGDLFTYNQLLEWADRNGS
jgi:protein N-terminal glutamine amidohydrolase